MDFVTLTKEQFIDFADEIFIAKYGFSNWEFMLPKSGTELVINAPFSKNKNLECHIYTTLDKGDKTRPIGQDAIRIILYDVRSGKAVTQLPKVIPTGDAASVFDRLTDRVIEATELIADLAFCKKCGSHLVKRVNRTTGESFMACSAYPNCGKKVEHALRSLNDDCKSIESKTIISKVDIIPANHEVTTIEDMTPLVEVEDLYPSTCYPHFKYGFEKFNRLQSTILKHGYWKQDCNLVLGTSTSTGKTISGELFVWETLKVHKKKVCYVSPLKALTLEKFNDWTKSFGNEYKIMIMTGDFVLTEARVKELNEADMVCITSEMLDSKSRNHQSERSDWLFEVGLLITDESHLLTIKGRGDALESGIMRFCKLVPSARVLMLSATMPNVSEFKLWLTNLNGKITHIINNNWRPVVLEWNFIRYDGNSYGAQQESKQDLVLDLLKEYPNDKTLVFVHDKNSGRQIETKLKNEGVDCHFYNADLELSSRTSFLDDFAENTNESLKVLISTSGLAWGISTFASNVIIAGVTRGLNPIDELDIIQAGGRAGRLGWSDVGRCFLICDTPSSWKYKVSHPRNIVSTLLNVDILGFHVLAEVANSIINDKDTLKEWFSRSLAFIQTSLDDTFIDKVLKELLDLKMINVDAKGTFKITTLGRISASLYYYPRDVYHWAVMFSKLDDLDLWKSDLAVSYVLGTTPSMQLDYVPKPEEHNVSNYYEALIDTVPQILNKSSKRSVIASDLYNLITEQSGQHMYARTLKNDIDRIIGAVNWIDSLRGWERTKSLDVLALRVKHGVRSGLAEFCSLQGVGVTRARKLESAGIKTLKDIVLNPDKVAQLLGKTLAPKVVTQAKQMIKKSF